MPNLPVDEWKRRRQVYRSNLLSLCNEVLGFKDVSLAVHGPLLRAVQWLPGGVDTTRERPTLSQLLKEYKPLVPLQELPPNEPEYSLAANRSPLILVSRGFLKSTIITVAHTIQWILNYPDIRILVSSGTETQAKKFVEEVVNIFRYNDIFRAYFPEFCPQRNPKEFGNQQGFQIGRRKEPTVSLITFGSTIAGGHYDVVINDDLVDKENVRTPEQIAQLKSHFAYIDPLVERYSGYTKPDGSKVPPTRGWNYLVGTIYHFSDLHYTIWDAERPKPKRERQWRLLRMPACYNYPKGPLAWPDRWTLEDLQAIERDPARGPSVLYSQHLLSPLTDKEGLCDEAKLLSLRLPKEQEQHILPRLRPYVTIDLAGMEPATSKGSDNDDTVLNLHGWAGGRLYFCRLWVGKFTPDEVIDLMFDIYRQQPNILAFKIEKDAHARVLLPFLRKEMARREVFLPVTEIQRDNRTSKQQRIRGLQPYFHNDAVRFLPAVWEDETVWRTLVKQVKFFPKYDHDDILDTMADAMQSRDGEMTMDMVPAPTVEPRRQPPPLEAAPLHLRELFGWDEDAERETADATTGW